LGVFSAVPLGQNSTRAAPEQNSTKATPTPTPKQPLSRTQITVRLGLLRVNNKEQS